MIFDMKDIRRSSGALVLFSGLLFCLTASLFSSCGDPEPVNISDDSGNNEAHSCSWHDDKNAVFLNPQLLLPCSSGCSDNTFQNYNLGVVLETTWSLCNVMDNVILGLLGASDFEFKWTTTFTEEITCADFSPSSKLITLSPDNYQSRISYTGSDILVGTPYVPDTTFVSYSNHKHELVFILNNVENTYENSFGTVVWTMEWPGPTSVVENEWWFCFPYDGVVGTYKPNKSYAPTRIIYINGQYEEI
jgi:hypothetical protein